MNKLNGGKMCYKRDNDDDKSQDYHGTAFVIGLTVIGVFFGVIYALSV